MIDQLDLRRTENFVHYELRTQDGNVLVLGVSLPKGVAIEWDPPSTLGPVNLFANGSLVASGSWPHLTHVGGDGPLPDPGMFPPVPSRSVYDDPSLYRL